MDPYAVVETGGKQYLVQAGAVLQVERLDCNKGDTVDNQRVLAVSDGQKLSIGMPDVAGARVTFTVVDHVLGDKLVSFKKKRRKGYHRKVGHRQGLTVLKTESISQGA